GIERTTDPCEITACKRHFRWQESWSPRVPECRALTADCRDPFAVETSALPVPMTDERLIRLYAPWAVVRTQVRGAHGVGDRLLLSRETHQCAADVLGGPEMIRTDVEQRLVRTNGQFVLVRQAMSAAFDPVPPPQGRSPRKVHGTSRHRSNLIIRCI